MKITNALIEKAGCELNKRFKLAQKEHCVIKINMKNDGRNIEITPIWCRYPNFESDMDFADVFCVYMILNDGGRVGLQFMHSLSFEELVYNILIYDEYDLGYLEDEELYVYRKGIPPAIIDLDTVLKKSK